MSTPSPGGEDMPKNYGILGGQHPPGHLVFLQTGELRAAFLSVACNTGGHQDRWEEAGGRVVGGV